MSQRTRPVFRALGYTLGAGISSEALHYFMAQNYSCGDHENWQDLGLMNADSTTIPSYSHLTYRKLVVNFLWLVKLN